MANKDTAQHDSPKAGQKGAKQQTDPTSQVSLAAPAPAQQTPAMLSSVAVTSQAPVQKPPPKGLDGAAGQAVLVVNAIVTALNFKCTQVS